MKKFVALCAIVCVVLVALGLTACQNKSVVKYVELASMPDKINYYIGETLDLTGCALNVVRADGSVTEVPVTADMVSPLETSGIGPKTLIITYADGAARYTTTMVLHVVSRPAQQLRILTPPNRTVYVDGDRPDMTGLTLEVYYTEEQRIQVTADDVSYSNAVLAAGTTSVRVGFANLTLDVPIEVQPVQVVGLRAYLREEALYKGQTVLPSLFLAVFVYNNGREETASSLSLAEEGQVLGDVDTFDVHVTATHVTYGTFSCEMTATVREDTVQSVTLRRAPLYYEVGAAFRWQDVRVDVTYAHSVATDLMPGTMGITADPADGAIFDVAGARDVTVSAGAVSCTIRVGVGVVVPVRWHVLDGESEVVQVKVGEVPTPQFLRLRAVLSDGSEVDVWNRFTAAQGADVTLPSAATIGQSTATLVYEGLAYAFAVSVTE